MADQEPDSGEKEFDATDAKQTQAREDGNVPQSKEANALALIVGILCAGGALQMTVGRTLFNDFSSLLYHADSFAGDVFGGGGGQTQQLLFGLLVQIGLLFLILAAVVVVSLVIQRAISFSFKKIALDMKKLSPVENLKKRYGPRGITDFLKDMVKLGFAVGIAIIFLAALAREYYASSAIEMGHFAGFTFSQAMKLILWFLAFQVVLAAIDLPLQRRLHDNRLKMSREEMKKEMKQSEGDPQLKQSRRQAASRITRGQMMQNVPTATVVMVNPQHYAVALKWDPDDDKAPVCVAKGMDHIAAKIREIAIASNVPIYRDPPSTRSIYRLVEVDEEIHPEHFAAVAAAINFVDRIRKHM
ncbi:EscU/YscU/HrcU family type III secretion system export apparatus switch protein [Hyphomonas johnsonii]|uniref:FlhB/HrpN/YscU/SpaS family protein n=1 Tax=Hyphomonas johnsonii MHS-2 TaxID=1280950 RepID=A0A059FNP4_9PROT|nr:flagellar type III secretion system protein FlhB [Hyphomonas johnsonii]KCZ92242.1 FlhB/HrpN/YscU/SpaS family protein [Hyphomonas johnsonii MHS-2]